MAALGAGAVDGFAQWTQARALNVLAAHGSTVTVVAVELPERNTLSGDEIRPLVAGLDTSDAVTPIRTRRPRWR